MEESCGPMERYWVAARERVADGRRSVRRRGEETAAGECGWRGRESSSEDESACAEETSFGGTCTPPQLLLLLLGWEQTAEGGARSE